MYTHLLRLINLLDGRINFKRFILKELSLLEAKGLIYSSFTNFGEKLTLIMFLFWDVS